MPYAWTPTFTGYHTRATRRGRGSWAGRRHEAISIDGELATADSVTWQTHRPGGTRPFASDMYALMADLAEDPTNARAQFYLAQTHKDMGSTTLAIDAYDARVRMGGWAEEVFYAAYMGGVLAADAGRADWIHRLLAAHELRPTRVEPFYELARRLRVDGLYRAALMYADAGASIRSRDDVLFTSPWMADWGLKFEASICEYYCGEPNRCIVMSRELLSRDDVPVVHRAALESNIRCAEMLMAAPA